MSLTESLVASQTHKQNTEAADVRTNHDIHSYHMTASLEQFPFSAFQLFYCPMIGPGDAMLVRYGQSSFLAGFINDILDTTEGKAPESSGRVHGKD
jgi:hypothetical protein